jgi:dTDP-4-dehydrorhamnose 3,5-epimerase
MEPVKDPQTITPEGELLGPYIHGVEIRRARTIQDERGEICEIFDARWGFTSEPLVYVYQAMIRPGKVKGWVIHRKQNDRLFFNLGTAKVVLYDDREKSPTHRMINEIYLGERDRGVLVIPGGVYHAIQNIGIEDLYFTNMPTRAYDHADPDKYRLPSDSDLIPYRFEDRLGW